VQEKRLLGMLLVAEAVFLLLPVSLLSISGGVLAFDNAFRSPNLEALAFVVLMFLSWVALVCGWILMCKFASQGSQGLRAVNRWLFVACASGMIIAVVGAILFANSDSSRFVLFALGLPAAVPFLHVMGARPRAGS